MDGMSNAETSSRVDIARRLFLASTDRSYLYRHTLECQAMSQPDLGMFVPYPTTASMSWRERLREWKRWTLPVGPDPRTPTWRGKSPKLNSTWSIEEPSTNSTTMKTPFDPPPKDLEVQSRNPAKNDYSNWAHRQYVQTSIVVGNVLHSFHEGCASTLEDLSAPHLQLQLSRMFLPTAPNISRIIEESSLVIPAPIESTTVRFLPNPWALGKDGQPIGTKALISFPPVEIEFSYSEKTRNLLLKDVRAIVDFESSDLLLPECPNDLRLQKQGSCRLSPSILSMAEKTVDRIPSLASFISKSKLDPRSDQQLITPAGLVLPISKYLCKRGAHKLLKEQSGNIDYNVEYLYAGLEYRNKLALNYRGWRLIYTSVEAGKAGGRRSELCLRPVREDALPLNAEDFLEAALNLANAQQTTSSQIARKLSAGARKGSKTKQKHQKIGFGEMLFKGMKRMDDADEMLGVDGQKQVAMDVQSMMDTLQATVQKREELEEGTRLKREARQGEDYSRGEEDGEEEKSSP